MTVGPDGYSSHFNADEPAAINDAYLDNGIDNKLDKILVVLVALEAEVRELWMRLERLEHPAIVIKANYPHRNRGDFDD